MKRLVSSNDDLSGDIRATVCYFSKMKPAQLLLLNVQISINALTYLPNRNQIENTIIDFKFKQSEKNVRLLS